MNKRIFFSCALVLILSGTAVPEEKKDGRSSLGYADYLKKVQVILPEIRSNSIVVLQAQNEINRAKGSGDVKINAGGEYYDNREYVTMLGNRYNGRLKGYTYYGGLSKKVVSTGTDLSTTFNYDKYSYKDFNAFDDYSTYGPSVSIKISQPLLYNFLGKVDRFAGNDAKMKAEIEKLDLAENNKSVLNAYKKLYFQWILYRRLVEHMGNTVRSAEVLRDQTLRKMRAGLADNDDYQKAAYSVLSYQSQHRDYLTGLKNIEQQLGLYIDIVHYVPDNGSFDELLRESGSNSFNTKEFKDTRSAKIIELSLENLGYAKDVYRNKLLPELNVYTGVTKKNQDSAYTMGMNDTDYSVGFEFVYHLGNNEAKSALRDVELGLKSLAYEYDTTLNSYRKNLSSYIQSAEGAKNMIRIGEESLKTLTSQLATEHRKYSQARLNLSYLIETENSIKAKKIEVLNLQYKLIGYYIDYRDITE